MNKKKILVFGSGGYLGCKIQEYCATCNLKNIEFAFHLNYLHYFPRRKLSVDVRKLYSIEKVIDHVEPDCLINLTCIPASICETEPESAREVNIKGALNIAKLCYKNSIRLIHLSTDMVFSGNKKGLYEIEDIPHPISVYGKTKLLGENCIKDSLDDYAILRSALIIGEPTFESTGGFLYWMADNILNNRTINLYLDQIRTPIIVLDLVKAIINFSESSFSGTLHCGGDSVVNRVKMGEWLTEGIGFGKEFINMVKIKDIKSSVPIQRNLSMNNSKFKLITGINLTDLREHIVEFGKYCVSMA